MAAFSQDAVRRFEDRMVARLAEFAPEQCAALGEDELRRVVGHGVVRAARHGLVSGGQISLYLGLMFAFGRDFDDDPALPWAREVLLSADAPALKGRRLYDAAMWNLHSAGRGLDGRPAADQPD